ncbi:MAG: LysR family transcriptional regulator, partial [Peristeroidobacter soli]
MKFRRLPHLHTLEAFESAARHLSFKLAAQELHLTASAISHQIKSLEILLGIKLFRRGNRSLELTKDGGEYLELVRDTLTRLRDGS